MVAAIISYCTNDFRFLKKAVSEVEKFASQIIVVVSDHFFHGKKEDRNLLEHTYFENRNCEFIEFAYGRKNQYARQSLKFFNPQEKRKIWHSTSRYIGYLFLKPVEYVLFLDADEIIEGDPFAKWLEIKDYQNFSAIRFFSYYYLQKAHLRASLLQLAPLMARYDALQGLSFFQVHERAALFSQIEGKKAVGGLFNNHPFFHHYSWTRTKKECYQKGLSWGHKNDFLWQKEIENSFEGSELRKFFKKDFSVEQVDAPFFDPLKVAVPKRQLVQRDFPHVKKISFQDVRRKELDALF